MLITPEQYKKLEEICIGNQFTYTYFLSADINNDKDFNVYINNYSSYEESINAAESLVKKFTNKIDISTISILFEINIPIPLNTMKNLIYINEVNNIINYFIENEIDYNIILNYFSINNDKEFCLYCNTYKEALDEISISPEIQNDNNFFTITIAI